MCDKDGEYVGHLLARCGQLCKQRMDQNLQNYDVTQAQAHVILYLIEAERQGEVYQKDLEKRFRIKAVSYTHLDVYKRQRQLRPQRSHHPGAAGDGSVPVSYTHLDVYKRQGE